MEPLAKELSDFEKLVAIPPKEIDSIANAIVNKNGKARSDSDGSRTALTEALISQTPQSIRAFFHEFKSLSCDNLTNNLDEHAIKISEVSDSHIVVGYWITGEPVLVEKATENETLFVENYEYSDDGPISPLAPSLKHYLALVDKYTDGPKVDRWSQIIR